MTGMDTVSWLSFFTASGLGAALGVLSLTALGACLYLRAPGAEAGWPSWPRRWAVCWSSSMGAVPCWKNGGSSGGGGSRPPCL